VGRRERLQRKAERRREWAAGARGESARRLGAAQTIADGIPFGQPILVGHHSERHARRDQERIESNMRAGVEAHHRAENHLAKAGGIDRQLETSVFNDDPDAIETLLTRIAKRKAELERCKEINTAIRREMKKGEGWLDRCGLSLEEKQAVLRNAQGWQRPEFPGYHLSNLGAAIRRDEQRIEAIRREARQYEKANEAGGTLVEPLVNGYVRVTFETFPGREVINALKAAGFYWSRPSWIGPADRLPAGCRGGSR